MSGVSAYAKVDGCPPEPPPFTAMSAQTRLLHDGIDAQIRRRGIPYLHPDDSTVQLDLFGSAGAIAWQEGKAAFLFAAEGCWADLPHLYARYGTTATAGLGLRLKTLEAASSVLAVESGMQATALVFDVLMRPGAHAVLMRQVYNKTRAYLEWLAARVGGRVSIVDDGEPEALAAAIESETVLVYAETFTNPLVRAQDLNALRAVLQRAKARVPGLVWVLDTTIATPWAFAVPALDSGVDVVVASGTKALGGQDRDLWGYIATRDSALANSLMDLLAMRGGVLDWRRAAAILNGLDAASDAHAQRCATATRIAAFLARHPKVGEVFHPSLPSHPDAVAIGAQYLRHGSMISFRIAGADEAQTRHFCDVLATSVIVRYALSFDGLATKVNHHRSVSEYFTPEDLLIRNGFDRLVRLAVGMEDADDLMAALNWALHHSGWMSPGAVAAWQAERRQALGLT